MVSYNEDINYKFHEDVTIIRILKYIDQTYDQHYAQGKIQATELVFDAGHGEGFCIGNILKYAQRFGKKDIEYPTADLYKVIHYAMILLGHIQHESSLQLEKEMREYEEQMNMDRD